MQDLIQALIKTVGEEHVAHSPKDKLVYSHICGPGGDFIRGQADVIVMPGSTAEVSRIMQLASRTRTPVVPRAAGSSHHGAQVPQQGGIVIDLARMNKILEIDERKMVVVAQGGASVYNIMRQLDERDLRFPQQPQYTSGVTIGAAVSCNISGVRVTRWGRFGEHLVGLEVVLPDGEILMLGSNAYRSKYGHYHRYMGGPDIMGLFVNSGGAMGVFTEVAVRVDHRMEVTDEISYGWPRDKIEEMVEAIYWMQRYDVCDVTTLNRWNYYSALQRGRVNIPENIEFINNISVDGHSKEEYDIAEHRFRQICEKHGGTDLGELGRFTKGGPRYHAWRGIAVWTGREFGPMFYHPTHALPEIYEIWERTCHKYGLWSPRYIPGWFSNTEQNVLYTYPLLGNTYPEDPVEVENLRQWYNEFHIEITKLGCVEYLIGDIFPKLVVDNLGPAAQFIKRLKRMMDPDNIMNPMSIWR